MITKQNVTEEHLFSRYDNLLSQVALQELDKSWQGVFRRMILRLLTIEKIEARFSHETGRPTKELYSVCDLLMMMEYFGWTLEQARMNYMIDLTCCFGSHRDF